MDKYKFRAWDGEKMTYDFIISPSGKYTGESGEKDYPIMQFTGMCDNNGVDIYEADVLKYTYGGETFYISRVGFYRGAFNLHDQTFHENSETRFLRLQYIEVIGNEYETPELAASAIRDHFGLPK